MAPDFLATLPRSEIASLARDWACFCHPHQRPPDAANDGGDWTTWLLLGGRGAGKTRAGAQWVRALALDCEDHDPPRIALVGETEHEVRDVMIEGVSGLLSVHGDGERPQWLPSRRRLEWNNGAVAQVFSAENFEALRGPQFHAAWLDELAKWKREDPDVPINRWRSPRAPLSSFATFAGFTS